MSLTSWPQYSYLSILLLNSRLLFGGLCWLTNLLHYKSYGLEICVAGLSVTLPITHAKLSIWYAAFILKDQWAVCSLGCRCGHSRTNCTGKAVGNFGSRDRFLAEGPWRGIVYHIFFFFTICMRNFSLCPLFASFICQSRKLKNWWSKSTICPPPVIWHSPSQTSLLLWGTFRQNMKKLQPRTCRLKLEFILFRGKISNLMSVAT